LKRQSTSVLFHFAQFINNSQTVSGLGESLIQPKAAACGNLAHDRPFLSEVITIKETSYGIDPHCRYFGVVVWRRWILGSP
jgi:hypothetical protein